MISARLDAVSEIALSMGSYKGSQSIIEIDVEDSDVTIMQPEFSCMLSSVLTYLGRSPDIQRGITRIFHRTATPAEVSSPSLSLLLSMQHGSNNYSSSQVHKAPSILFGWKCFDVIIWSFGIIISYLLVDRSFRICVNEGMKLKF